MAQLADLRIDEAIWRDASDLRRAEWRISRNELLSDSTFGAALAQRYLLVTPLDAQIRLEALDDEGHVRWTGDLRHRELEPLVREYQAIIRRLDENADHRELSWIEAVDMAKKVVHDKAARTLFKSLPELSDDFPTLRRVFTFYFALVVDTTQMRHARGHAPYRG